MAETPLARVGQTEEIEIVWRPFELRPEPAPPPPADYIERAWTQSVEPLARQMAVEMRRPPFHPRTRLAHEAAAFAGQQGKLTEMASALLVAYWQQGRDIGQIDVLCEIGGEIGLDGAALRQALEERELGYEVTQELQLAQQYGITAVPSFVVGNRYLLRGLVTEEQLRQAIQTCRGEGLIQLD